MIKFGSTEFFNHGVFFVGNFYCKGKNKLIFKKGTFSFYEEGGFFFEHECNNFKEENKIPFEKIFKDSFLKKSEFSMGLLYYKDVGRIVFDFDLFCRIQYKNDEIFFSCYNSEEWVFITFEALSRFGATFAWQAQPDLLKEKNPFDLLRISHKKGSDLLNDI